MVKKSFFKMHRLGLGLLFYVSAASALSIPATSPELQYIGRFEQVAEKMRFDFAGCEIRARIELDVSATVTASLAQRHLPVPPDPAGNTKNSGFETNAFVVFVDGVRQGAGGNNATFTTTAEQLDDTAYDFHITTGNAPLAVGTHDIRIIKATEPDWNGGDPVPNYVTFSGLKIEPAVASRHDVGASARVRVVDPPPLPARKIEFLGDSITAGFCNECKEYDAAPGDHNEAFLATWDYRIGEILGAQVHTVAWSGLGMVRNCCGGNTTMPAIYSRTLATVNIDNTWDFSTWQADALVVNLGTNDGAAATSPAYDYEGVYESVVQAAANKYAAGGRPFHAFLACGPMSETYCDPVHSVIANLTARGIKAHFLDQRGFLDGSHGPACCGHPGTEVDEAMATSAAAFMKSTLGW